jgi:hypothetical protein
MAKPALDVMHDVIFSAVMDSITSLKAASKGLPNTLLRDLNAIHANTTFSDLPNELQTAINESVRAAFTRLLKEGYAVTSGRDARPPDVAGRERRPPNTGRPPEKREGFDNRRGPRPNGPRSGPPRPRKP